MSADTKSGPYLVFEVGEAAFFALEVNKVWQVLETEGPPSPVPLAPRVVRGIISHHGKIVTVVDPAPIFGLAPQGERVPQIVVLRTGRRNAGNLGLQMLRSHGIIPAVDLKEAQVEKGPCVAWVAQSQKRLIQVVEVEALYERLSELFGASQAVLGARSIPVQGVSL
jgi:chemotaxis signal transduction protein